MCAVHVLTVSLHRPSMQTVHVIMSQVRFLDSRMSDLRRNCPIGYTVSFRMHSIICTVSTEIQEN